MQPQFVSIGFIALLLGVPIVYQGTTLAAQHQTLTIAETANRDTRASAASLDSRPNPAENNVPTPDFVIGPSDVLSVNVWRDPEVSRTVPVRPDGKISLPLAGDLVVSGLTATEVQTLVKQRLRGYISNPEVTVIVQEVKSQQINIFGEVAKPGSYTLGKTMTVLDALAVAGGLADFAKIKKIYVLRVGKDGRSIRIPFNYKQVIQGHNPGQDIELQARDTVVVP